MSTKSVATHPPGPWHVEKYDALNTGVWRHVVKDQNGEMIAAAYGNHDVDIARLIAAAPELLEAAREACDALFEWNKRSGTGKRLAAVIAKAEGRHP